MRKVLFLCALAAMGSCAGLVAQVAAAPPPPPKASFTRAPQSPLIGQPVTFTSTSVAVGQGNAIVKNEWDLDGDGTFELDTGDLPVASHPGYAVAGPVNVSLRVTDKKARSAVVTHAVTVRAPAGDKPPIASFDFLPSSPLAGDTVTFFSTSVDPDSPIVAQRWDLDQDGVFDDAAGPTATATFAEPGRYAVSLRVEDAQQLQAVATRTVIVGATQSGSGASGGSGTPVGQGGPAGQLTTPRPRLLSPFPIVRIVGTVSVQGTLLRRITVTAPRGSKVRVRCRGRRCPVASWSRAARSRAHATRLLRVRRFERRLLPAGVKVEVFVTKARMIGKYTRFTIRKRRSPARIDRCLRPGVARPVRCPRA